MRNYFLVLLVLAALTGGAQTITGTVVLHDGTKFKNTRIIQIGEDNLMILFSNQEVLLNANQVRRINQKRTPERSGIIDVEMLFQMNSSRPGKDRSAKADPSIMTSLLYRIDPRLQAGLGTGLQSPHFNTLVMPVYAQLNVTPLRALPLFVKTKLGNFIPMNPGEFEGGLFMEVALAKTWQSGGSNSFQLAIGYVHQKMTFLNEDLWWGSDRETTFRFNRLMFSAGFVF